LEVQEVQIVRRHTYNNRLADPELVDLCLEGDARAWETVVRRYRRLVYSIPKRYGLNKFDAADVFQTVIVKLIEHLHELKDESKLSPWLITTTTRTCIGVYNSRQREPVIADEEEREEPLDPEGNIEEIRLLAESQQELRDCVNELPEKCKELIEMLYFDAQDPSYVEISEATGIHASSIGPSRARCLEKLRRILRQRGIG
jgi:RNA polymerase sigma factor (sigma-70 family)